MANPLHADFYADQAVQRTATIIDNQKMAEGTFRVRFKCPEIAKVALPGQFLMLRINDSGASLGDNRGSCKVSIRILEGN